ncbi:hypothetical protein DYB37_000799 [Aphanomyces astaci]|uniref:Uncharacterized protein n=1 Tax=Aphanomyces astaci TaxID=112090 RepID=A0A3R6YA85_APHAT|nr:hypothetical protein DYB35_005921 [Aphanomyces astaci]RHZ06792.1 hypothetical protein DYB37_000799 [Aphanomyces astaci]
MNAPITGHIEWFRPERSHCEYLQAGSITNMASTNLTLDEAKAYLKEERGGVNLYDHLSEVLLKLLVERPIDATTMFEHLSCSVRQERFNRGEPPNNGEITAEAEAKSAQEAWSTSAIGLLKIAQDTPSGVSDLLDEANMFEWAGIGFSKAETFRLSLALQKLASLNGTTKLRFWGKLLGTTADFYVAEGELPEPYEPEDAAAEEGANGLNKNTYWVHGHPPFPGTEKNFIRAQIARINAGTVLCPAGFFIVSEEGELEVPEEAPEPKTAAELGDPSNWVHYTKEINEKYGRSTPLPPNTNDDGEEVPWEGEEFAEPLRAISEDKPGSWRVDRLPSTTSAAVGELAIARSLTWPGAVSIGVGKKFLNVYVGYGLKAKFGVDHQIQLPRKLATDFGVAVEGDTNVLKFTNLVEQPDVLVDPSPPEEGAEE